jgi:hypothetical protein
MLVKQLFLRHWEGQRKFVHPGEDCTWIELVLLAVQPERTHCVFEFRPEDLRKEEVDLSDMRIHKGARILLEDSLDGAPDSRIFEASRHAVVRKVCIRP